MKNIFGKITFTLLLEENYRIRWLVSLISFLDLNARFKVVSINLLQRYICLSNWFILVSADWNCVCWKEQWMLREDTLLYLCKWQHQKQLFSWSWVACMEITWERVKGGLTHLQADLSRPFWCFSQQSWSAASVCQAGQGGRFWVQRA